MKRIGLIADTHGVLDDAVIKELEKCEEIWLAGDFGSVERTRFSTTTKLNLNEEVVILHWPG